MKTNRLFLTNPSEFSDVLISDFTEPLFQNAFKNCFSLTKDDERIRTK